jgi:hypothetical protein
LADGCEDHTVHVPRELTPVAAAAPRWFTPWAWAGATAGLALLLLMIVPRTLRDRVHDLGSVHDSLREQIHTKKEPVPAAKPLRVAGLNVKHFANVNNQSEEEKGLLGRDSFACRLGDAVTLEAKLSRPAYAYLIAYRPDGTEQLCFPEHDDKPPPFTDLPRYPSESRGDQYGLDEGTGLMAFVLVASRRPLPAYRDWRKARDKSPWKHYEAPGGVVWYDDGSKVEARTPESHERGRGKKVPGQTPLVGLTDWLRKGRDVEAVVGVGFAVLPKEKR